MEGQLEGIEIIELKKRRKKVKRTNSSQRRKKSLSEDERFDDEIPSVDSNFIDSINFLLDDGAMDVVNQRQTRISKKNTYNSSKSDTEMKDQNRNTISLMRKNASNYDLNSISDRDEIEQSMRENPEMFVDFTNKEILYQIPKLRRLFTPTGAKKRGVFSEFVIYNGEAGPYTSISAGTLRDLIEWCSFFPGSSSARNLLLFYRSIYTPEYFLNSILDIFCAYELRTTLVSQDILERFYAFIVQWIIYWYPRDFDDQLRRALVQFLGQKISPFNNGQALHHIHYLLRINERPPNHRFGSIPIFSPNLTETKRRIPKLLSPRSFSNFPILSPRAKPEKITLYSEFKYYSIPSYVQFITVLESSLFDVIELEEFLDKNWQKENKNETAPNLCRLSDHFNKVSLWVASVILSTSSIKKQIKIMRRFIRIARKLLKIRNYSSAAQIISGLNNISVSRLKAIKNGLSEKYRKILESIEDKFNPRDNYKQYRKLPKHPPCLPFLPVYLRDLSVIFDTTPTFVDKENKVISLDKINAIGTIIYNDICLHNRNVTSYYFFVPDYHLEAFKNMLENLTMDEDALYARSVHLQPVNSVSTTNLLHFNSPNVENNTFCSVLIDNNLSPSQIEIMEQADLHLDPIS